MPDGTLFTAASLPPLNDEQRRAREEILAARGPGQKHLLTGHAGSGKTYLLAAVVQDFKAMGLKVSVTAPTHKAVAVLRAKLAEAGVTEVDCRTTYSLLGLRPKPQGEKLTFVRDRKAKPIEADVVIADECSMLNAEIMRLIRRHLAMAFVLFCGDPAQLPPVGEEASESFAIKSRSHLGTIVRQAAGNPILLAADAIRRSQEVEGMDWSWARTNRVDKFGVFCPSVGRVDEWMKKAFTSEAFEADPDRFRYLAWTNARVARVNAQVQAWRYGPDLATPFAVGERVLFRAALMRGDEILFGTNEEAPVLAIEPGSFRFTVPEREHHAAWAAEVPSWCLTVPLEGNATTEIHMPTDERLVEQVAARIIEEAASCKKRWEDLHEFRSALAVLQCCYCMTIHTSQGSTFGYAFVHMPEIRKAIRVKPREGKQLAYVAATRPSTGLILVGG